ncbi:MAG: TetR/AcrR family transcriptional regulator [bacterium]|nr:TetR/AcrR family transcriptional regulator [bacterium]
MKTMIPGKTTRGQHTRMSILSKAMQLASKEGLEGLSIGRLSTGLNMSKSGLLAHFGSKEDLQLATVDLACDRYNDQIVQPALKSTKGITRLMSLCGFWLKYHEQDTLPGGCFFLAVSSEFDSRAGRVRKRIKFTMSRWLRLLKRELYHAQKAGEIQRDTDTEQIAFELNAIGHGANWAYQLYEDRGVFQKARHAIERTLQAIRS